jgi:hypothetical protein
VKALAKKVQNIKAINMINHSQPILVLKPDFILENKDPQSMSYMKTKVNAKIMIVNKIANVIMM